MRPSRTTAAIVAALVLALLALSPAAWSYFSSAGAGSAQAAVGTLAAPSNVSASPSGATVALSWTGPTAPGGGPVDGYYVERSVGAAGGSCASSASSLLAASPTGCTDTAVPSGTYTYTVVAVYRSWTAGTAGAPVTVAPAVAVDHFEVTSLGGVTAGVAFDVTVTAKDASNATVPGYVGTVHFSSTDGQAVLPADYTFVASDAGTRSFTGGATLKTAGSHSVNVNDVAEPAKAGSAAVTVAPAAPSRLAFVQQPTNATAGTTITPAVTVRIDDQYGNPTSSTASVNLAVTSGGVTLLGTTTRPGVAGVATFSGLSVTKSGTWTLTATGSGLTGATSASFTITAGTATRLVFTSSSRDCSSGSVAVGNGGTFTSRVSVVDTFGNPVPVASGRTVALANNQSNARLSPTSLSIATGSAETAASFGQSIPVGNPPNHVVTASSSGLTSVTCAVNK